MPETLPVSPTSSVWPLTVKSTALTLVASWLKVIVLFPW